MKPILALASVLMISPCFGQPPVPPPVVIQDHGHDHEPEQRPPLPPGVVMPPDLGHGGHGHEHGEPTAPPPVVKLALDAPPKFSTLTEAGFRFLVPQPHVGPKDLKTERVALAIGGLEPLACDYVGIEFRNSDLTPPGPYYPPAPAVGPDTPVRRVGFLAEVQEDKISDVIKGLLPLLGIDPKKPEAWVENQLWDVAESVRIQGTVPGGESGILLFRDKNGSFRMQVTISWGEPERQPGLVPSDPQRRIQPRRLPLVPGH